MNLSLFVKQSYRLIFAFSLILLASGFNSKPGLQVNNNDQVRLEQFDLLTDTSGWVLLDKQLFWTSDAGQTWREIGPALPTDAFVEDVKFIDATLGWVLLSTINPEGSALFQLAQTTDGGVTWATRALSLFESGESASFMEKADMGWFDAQTGWISVKQASGSNFSIGTLFITSDGGETWHRSSLPVADRIVFNDPQTGWAVGGPTGDQIFKTQDAGVTWQNLRPDDLSSDAQAAAYPPSVSGGQGLLVMTNTGSENNLNVYRLETSSDRWSLFDQMALDVQPGIIGLSILDPQNFVATIPGTSSIIRMVDGGLDRLANADGLSDSIVALDMVSLDVGWAKSVDSNCTTASSSTDQTASITCSSTTRLLQTADGGVTWQSVPLPDLQSGASAPGASGAESITSMNTVSSLGATNVFVGQGFDKCEIPSRSQMQKWWDNSPYKTVNLYIGGSSQACANTALTASYLEKLNLQGWQFIPTWVGPQAPCTGFTSRISSDVTSAYNEGVDQANLAVERLAELGLTQPNQSGSVVYYDMEYYGTNTVCRDAVNAFMNGWVSQIHARGNQAGVYGSTLCNTGLSDFRTITNAPDVIWPARWYHNMGEGFYDPSATVWNLGSCLPDSVWADHQRIRQYEGDHNETWGSLTLGIDSNVLDGAVAVPATVPLLDPSRISFQEVASGLNNPVFITNAGDHSGRMFIIERAGKIRIIKNGKLLATPFLDIQSIVKSTGGEQGLLGLAFHPSYGSNGKFYVVYTAPRSGDGSVLTLRQYSVSSGNPDLANGNSGTDILTIDHPTYANHNGGTLAFGNDGYLYWSIGDGGSGGDPNNNAQNLGALLGKILRIDVNSGSPYSIPASNPFYNDPNTDTKKIWAYGLRNPWRISFDRLTHDLYIGDVGQSTREEVDFQPASSGGGENYGWRVMEGSLCYNPSSGCNQSGKTLPVAEYDHSLGCSITGGYVYRGLEFPLPVWILFLRRLLQRQAFQSLQRSSAWVEIYSTAGYALLDLNFRRR